MKRTIVAAVLFLGYACATVAPPVQQPETMEGIASWYGQEFAGRTTANGEIFDPLLLTAAHRSLPFGTVVDVVNPATSQTVRVRINDRGPYIGNRVIDLSYAAAQKIGLVEPGSGNVQMTVVRIGKGEREPPAPYSVTVAAPATTVPTATDVPAVDFPLPGAVKPSAPATSSAATEVTVDRIQVVEEHAGKETHRQVSADGKTIENIPVIAPAPVETRRQVSADGRKIEAVTVDPNGVQVGAGKADPSPDAERMRTPVSAPGHSAAARLDAALQRGAGMSSPASHAPSRFVVQVGAFADEKNALALQNQLHEAGFESHIDHTTLHRVQMGPFDKREQALQIRQRLETAGLSAMIVTAQ